MNNKERFDIIKDILVTLQTSGKAPAFFIDGSTYSYEQLGGYVADIYQRISHLPDANIGVVAEDSIETYATILAVLFSGKA